MADHDFELRLQRVLRADAERAVRPLDPVDFAEVRNRGRARRAAALDWRPAGWPAIRLVLIATLLILAAVATLWLATVGASRSGRRSSRSSRRSHPTASLPAEPRSWRTLGRQPRRTTS